MDKNPDKHEPVNIYDIARLAGVSIATVSRVMNNSSKVSEKTRRKVEKIIREIDYTPNAFAKGLGLNTMHTIGILVPTVADAYMSTAVDYVERYLARENYHCILSCSGFSFEEKKLQTEMLLSKHIDALLFIGSTYAGRGESPLETEYIREAARKVPVFTINGSIQGDNIYSTVSDDHSAVYDITCRMIDSGRRDLLFMTDSRSYSANKKKKGFLDAAAARGLPIGEDRVFYVENDIAAVREYLKREDLPYFNGLIATEDGIAIGAVKYALDMGRSVPGDLSVTGYNNYPISLACEPELTSIDCHMDQICSVTVQGILACLQENRAQKPPHERVIPYSIIERKTTDFGPKVSREGPAERTLWL